MTQRPVTLLIIDDHPMLRQGVKQVIELDDDLTCVGDAGSGEEGVKLAISLNPDVILLDLNMRGMSGIDTLKALHQAKVRGKIIIFTVSDFQDDIVAALKAGADGYLLKDTDPAELLDQLKLAHQGQVVISQGLVALLATAIKSSHAPDSEPEPLTRREIEILKLLIEGYSNKLIGRRLDIAEGTVKVHIKHILKKLNLKTRVEAAVWAAANLEQ
jgi:two-component system nitrate/nitrite response regulator NarL